MTHSVTVKSVLIKITVAITVLALAYSPLVLAATGTTSSSSTLPIYRSQWGGTGAGNGQFASPYGIAVDSEGNVYAADAHTNDLVQKFTSDGTFLTQWGGTGAGNGQFDEPQDIAIDSSGNIYVTDVLNERIQKFTLDGTFISSFGGRGSAPGQFYYPSGIAIDSNDNMYTTDITLDRVQKFAPDGAFVTQWGISGTGNGQFNDPSGITVDSTGNVYVIDTNNHRVQKFAPDGTFITKWGTNGTGDSQFRYPQGIFAYDDIIYVLDTDNDQVKKFTTDGTFIAKWGSGGTGNGQFDGIRGIAIDDSGNVYVADTANDRVQKFIYPQNLATLATPDLSSIIELALPEGSHITTVESTVDPGNDSSYDYPLGLVDFTFESGVGATTEVTFSFETDLSASDITARKYNSVTQAYTDIENAIITETTVNGNPGLQLVYNATDGGTLDEDGAANGIIVDPIGLATVQITPGDTPEKNLSDNNTPGTPDTGYGFSQPSPLSTLFMFGFSALVLLVLSVTIRKLYIIKTARSAK